MTALAAIRAATAGNHEMVDATFGRFDLSKADEYGRFLTAHALALPAIEMALADQAALPQLRSRHAALGLDLQTLGLSSPEPFYVARPGSVAEAFGMAYVIEGSRLGGTMLARTVPSTLPRNYLSASHLPGEWRAFEQALEGAAVHGDANWGERAALAAKSVFSLYRLAAETVGNA